jgi:MGT family glycosyltransferase
MGGLAQALQQRGHEVCFACLPEVVDWFEQRQLPVLVYSQEGASSRRLQQLQDELARLSGEAAVSQAVAINMLLARALMEEPSSTWTRSPWDLWIVDQLDYAAASLARFLDQPFATAVLTLLRNPEPGVPGFNARVQRASPKGRRREQESLSRLVAPYLEQLDRYRQRWQLSPFSYETIWSELAQVSQQPAFLEFPRQHLPGCFHFTGPFGLQRPEAGRDFPWHRPTGEKLVYVSFGTAQRAPSRVYSALWQAARQLPVQFVCSRGGQPADEAFFPPPPPQVLVVETAPQLQLLQIASAAVTHAGMNSTLESLAAGVPLLALPLAHDQPGVALRIEWSGVGLRLDPEDEELENRVHEALLQLLERPDLASRARQAARQIEQEQGLERACEIIDRVARTRRPVRTLDLRVDSSFEPPGRPEKRSSK